MPFSLSTKRSSSPPKGAYLRRSSPASSPVHINEGPFRTTRRSSPEIRTSPENRRSPTSPNLLSYRGKSVYLNVFVQGFLYFPYFLWMLSSFPFCINMRPVFKAFLLLYGDVFFCYCNCHPTFFYEVERPKSSGQSFGRTSSLDALYMSSQWPRSEISGGFPAPIVGKETQVMRCKF